MSAVTHWDDVAIEHRKDGVQMHMRAVLTHHGRDHAISSALLEQRFRDLLDHASLRPLAHPDQHCPIADRLHVTTLE